MINEDELFDFFKNVIVNSSQYIVKYQESFFDDEYFNLITEFCKVYNYKSILKIKLLLIKLISKKILNERMAI